MRFFLKCATIGLATTLVLAAGWLPAKAPEIPETWRFTLQGGDAAKGEQAFARMKCTTCHTVSGVTFAGVGKEHGRIGPELTSEYANLEREYLAESIMNPNRFVAHGGFEAAYTAPDGTSRMGDYSQAMTVRELVDIVEFLSRPRR